MAGKKEFPLSVVIRGVDRVTGVMGGVQRGILKFDNAIKARMSGFASRMRAFSDRLGLPVLAKATGRLGSAITDLGRRAAIMGGAIASVFAAAGLGIWRIVESVGTAGDALADVTKQIGVSAEALQEWRYAAKQNGVEAEKLDRSVAMLARNLGDAIAGQGEAKDVLKALGIDVKKFKSVEQLMPVLANKIKAIQNPMVRASVAARLFGRSGVELIPMLQDGADGLQAYAKEARRLGIVLSNDAVGQADTFGDRLEDLKLSMSGAKNIIGSQLLPVVTDLIIKLTNFVVSKGPQIQAFFKDFAAKLPGRLKMLQEEFIKLKDKVQPVIDVFGFLIEKFGPANVVIGTVATAIAIFLVPALYATATAFYAVGVAILTTPVGWILAAIVAIAAAAYMIYKKWGPIKEFFGTWWQAVKDVFSVVVDFFADIWTDVKDGFKDGFLKGLINLWMTLNPLNLIIRAFTDLLPKLRKAVAPLVEWAKGFFGGLVPDWAKDMFGLGGAPAAGSGSIGASRVGEVAAAGGQRSEARVQVDFNNLPAGSRVQTQTKGQPDFELNQGFAMGSP